MFWQQPKIEIIRSENQPKLITLGWLILAFNFITIAIFYADLPDKIPSHFNFMGDIDGYSAKDSIWTLPILMFLTYFLLNLLNKKIKPWNMNYPVKVTEKNAKELYKMSLQMLVILNLGISLIPTPIIVEILLKAHGVDLNFKVAIISILITVIITILPFFYIYKMFQIPK